MFPTIIDVTSIWVVGVDSSTPSSITQFITSRVWFCDTTVTSSYTHWHVPPPTYDEMNQCTGTDECTSGNLPLDTILTLFRKLVKLIVKREGRPINDNRISIRYYRGLILCVREIVDRVRSLRR